MIENRLKFHLYLRNVCKVSDEQYDIEFSFDTNELKITRSLDEITKFSNRIKPTMNLIHLESLSDEKSIVDFLTIIFENINNGNQSLTLKTIGFLDSFGEFSTLTSLYMTHLTDQMTQIQTTAEELGARLLTIENKFERCFSCLETLMKRISLPTQEILIQDINVDDPSTAYQNLASFSKGSENTDVNNRNIFSTSSTLSLSNFLMASTVQRSRSDSSSDDNQSQESAEVTEWNENNNDLFVFPAIDPDSRINESLFFELISFESICYLFNDEVNIVLKSISPYLFDLSPRLSITSMLQTQVRLSINSSLFEIDLHEIGCNLPDDPIKLSVLLGKSHFPNWHTSLSERLSLISDSSELSLNSSESKCKVSKTRNTTDEHGFKIISEIDNHIIDISANRRMDLFFLAFFEDISNLVGKENLFKKSIILTRAWWKYETGIFPDKSISDLIPDNTIVFLIAMIFNKYHRKIMYPLQALLFFLAELSLFDPSCSIITLQGIVAFDRKSKSPISLLRPQPSDLISSNVIEKYWHLYNSTSNPQFSNSMLSSQDNYLKAIYNNNSIDKSSLIDKNMLNILNPFTNQPFPLEKITFKKLTLILKVFSLGSNNLLQILKEQGCFTSVKPFSNIFFPNTLSKFSFRTEILISDNLHEKNPLFETSLINVWVEKIWQNILYSNFVLESVVTESAILTASVENLNSKGPLPVGEVGKMLTELSSMPQLSLHLKEKFGGLKKYLERFPEIFIFSNDHPFNPHVLLKSQLSPEYQKMIYRGVIPMQIMLTIKKSLNSKKSALSKTNIDLQLNTLSSISQSPNLRSVSHLSSNSRSSLGSASTLSIYGSDSSSNSSINLLNLDSISSSSTSIMYSPNNSHHKSGLLHKQQSLGLLSASQEGSRNKFHSNNERFVGSSRNFAGNSPNRINTAGSYNPNFIENNRKNFW